MRYIHLFSFFVIVFFKIGAVSAQPGKQNTYFEETTLGYIHLEDVPLSFSVVHFVYNLEKEKEVFQLHFTTTVKTYGEKQLSNNTDTLQRNYERARLVISMLCARDMNNALSKKIYSENYKTEIRETRDSVFNVYRTMFNNHSSGTEHGRNNMEQNKWENYLLLMLKNVKNDEDMISLKQESFVPIQIQNQEDFHTPKQLVYLRNRIAVIEDDFEDNESGWVTLEDDGIESKDSLNMKIGNGFLTVENRMKTDRAGFALYKDIDYSKDFEMEVSLKIKASKRKFSPAAFVFWGTDTSGNLGGSWISIDRSATLNITFCKGGDHKKDIHKYAAAFNKNKESKMITIRKVADKYYFFSGEQLVKTLTYQPLPGNAIHLGSNPQCSVAFDYFNFYYLE